MKNKYGHPLWVILSLLIFSACNKPEEYTAPAYTCIIVNQGNLSESNGSLSLLRMDGAIEQEVYTKVNNGWKLASMIESVTLHRELLIVMCNSADKVEILNNKTFEAVCTIKEIGIPRYCAVSQNNAYVTSWDSPNPNDGGQVCKIDLATKTVVKKIRLSKLPEGIKELNGLLYVASGNGVTVINPDTDEIVRQIELSEKGVTAKHLTVDYEGKLWVSFTETDGKTGIASLNTQTNEFSPFIPLENMDMWGNINVTPDGKKLLYLYADGVVGAQNLEAETAIYSFDIETNTQNLLFKGTGFYGFNVNPSNGDIYTANVNGFITNSMMYIYNASGEKINNGLTAGVGTCRFVFPAENR